MRLGESDLFLTGDDSDADKRESQDRLPPAGAELAVARVQKAKFGRSIITSMLSSDLEATVPPRK